MPMRPLPLVLIAATVALAGCAERPEPAPVVFRGTTPAARPAAPRPAQPVAPSAPQGTAPDAQGVVDYGGYSAVVARPGDTVASMADRVGLSASALAAYNGLPSGYAPRPGDELILPPAPSGPATVESAVLAPLGAPLDAQDATPATPESPAAPLAAPQAAPQEAPQAATGFDLSQIEAAIGDAPAAPTPRQTPPVSVSAPPAPVPQAAAPLVVATTEPAAKPAAKPETKPEARAQAPVVAAAPPAAPAARFVKPVDGAIARPFNRAAGARNDGVDFAAPQGATVVAAAPGQVALVSESLGGLGTIVLIRHEGDLLTVYGRVDGVTVKKGDRVQQGQTIGAVAPGAPGRDPSLHFEVRQGAESVDPARYLPG